MSDGDASGGGGPGAKAMVIAMLLTTVVSAGAAGGLAYLVHTKIEKAKTKASDQAQAPIAEQKLAVRTLPPILAKLSGQQAPWVRLTLSIVTPKTMPEADRFVEVVAQDIRAFIGTLQAEQIVGATNFAILRTDLQEILRIRSKGAATEVFIRGLLME